MATLYSFYQINTFFKHLEVFAGRQSDIEPVTPALLTRFVNGTFHPKVTRDLLDQYLASYPFITADELLNGDNYQAKPEQPDTNNQYLYDGYDAQTNRETIKPYTFMELIDQFKTSPLQIQSTI